MKKTIEFLRNRIGKLPNVLSKRSLELKPRTNDSKKFISICPYCAVGCSQTVSVKDNQIINIEGNLESPVNRGTLCPKGSATYGLVVNPLRLTKVKYRAPFSDHWQEKPLEWAMERIAGLVKKTRDETHQAYSTKYPDMPINRTTGIAHLGGATLDNEENYLIIKLFRSLGMVYIENQARV